MDEKWPAPDASVCIVGGCGHAGLPLGIVLARAGACVTLFDVDEGRVAEVAAGRMPFLERGADDALPAALATGRLAAVASPDVIGKPEVVIVTIGTQVDEFLDPAVRVFDKAMDRVLD